MRRTNHTTGMVRVYRYRLRPTPAQERALLETLARLRELYNAALQERRDAYRLLHASLTAYGQMKSLVEVRKVRPEYAAIHTHLLQDVISRLERAYAAFFRRLKAGQKPGFHRFKGRDRYRTFTFKDAGKGRGAAIVAGGKRVRLFGIGQVKVRLHRPIEGNVKQVSVTLSGDRHWYIAFVCDNVPAQPLPAIGVDVGIDVGLKAFLATSDGEVVDNPRLMARAAAEVARAQRCVARRKRGSRRRRKAVAILSKKHAHVQNQRRDFHHKTARALVQAYDVIAVEDLNVKGLAGGMLAKSVADVGWGSFLRILAGKAESAGREVVKVPPAGTSQRCAMCGATVPKTLAERTHSCGCGFVEDRDVNAALNIRGLGRSLRRGAAVALPNDPRSPCQA